MKKAWVKIATLQSCKIRAGLLISELFETGKPQPVSLSKSATGAQVPWLHTSLKSSWFEPHNIREQQSVAYSLRLDQELIRAQIKTLLNSISILLWCHRSLQLTLAHPRARIPEWQMTKRSYIVWWAEVPEKGIFRFLKVPVSQLLMITTHCTFCAYTFRCRFSDGGTEASVLWLQGSGTPIKVHLVPIAQFAKGF